MYFRTHKKLQYSEEALQSALNAIKAGESMASTSAKYGVPRTTLIYRISRKQPEKKFNGVHVVNKKQESKLVEWIVKRAKSGFPAIKFELQDTIKILVKNKTMHTPFTNNLPGRWWFIDFFKRNPEAFRQILHDSNERRAKITRENLDSWFMEVQDYLTNKGLLEIRPNRIFNCDETSIEMSPKGVKKSVKKNANSVEVPDPNDNETITCLFITSADGNLPPPLVLFPDKLPGILAQTAPKGWTIDCSEKGWLTGEHFFEYIMNTFHRWLVKNQVPLPVVLYVDGCKSYITLPLSEFCSSHGIEVGPILIQKSFTIAVRFHNYKKLIFFSDYCALPE